MKTFIRVFVAAAAGVSVTVALTQISPAKVQRSDEILVKARHLDLLNHLLPLLLTKDQYNKVLNVVEKCRVKVDAIKSQEATELARLEPKIDEAISKGVGKDLVPAKALLVELNKNFTMFSIRRRVIADENADAVLAVIKKELNQGQLKAAMNSHDIKAFDSSVDVSKLSDDDKLRFYIKDVILDPSARDLLIRLAKVPG